MTFTRYSWSSRDGEEFTPPVVPNVEPTGVAAISLDDRLRDVERTLINWALKMTRGNKSRAAGLLGIKRSTLGDRINRCGLGRTPVESGAAQHETSSLA